MPLYMVVSAASDYEAFHTTDDIKFFFKHNLVEADTETDAILIKKFETTDTDEILKTFNVKHIAEAIIECFVIEVKPSYLVSTPHTFPDLFKKIQNFQQTKLDDDERKEYERLKKKFG